MNGVLTCFLPGRLFALDGDTNEIVAEIDYTPISSSVVNPLWSAASTCDPLKDLKTAMRLGIGCLWIFGGSNRFGEGCFRCIREC